MYHCPFKYDDNHIFVMFNIKMSCIIVFLTITKSVMYWYFLSQLFQSGQKLNKV